jgi:hypothetical protein
MGANPSSFYVTLFSNSSMKAYPNNTIAAFTVELAHEIDLAVDKWKVVVCNFSYHRLALASETPMWLSVIQVP